MDARDSEALFQKILYAREAKGEQRAKLYQRTDEHTMTYKYKDITGVSASLYIRQAFFFHLFLFCSMESAISRVKSHLGLTHVRLALANGSSLASLVNSVGVCAGSGKTAYHAREETKNVFRSE